MKKYKLSARAEEDLWRIYQWGYHAFGEAKADEYHYNFLDQFDIIANQPYLYPTADNINKDYRRCICGVDIIYYKINDSIVEIIRILGRQDPDGHLI